MGLQPESGPPELAALLGQRDVVDAAPDHVGVDVDVEVEGATDELAGALRRGVRGHLGQISDKIVDNPGRVRT